MALHIDETFATAPGEGFAKPGVQKPSLTPLTATYNAAAQAVDLDRNSGSQHGQWRLNLNTNALDTSGVPDLTIEVDIEILASSTLECHTGFHLRTNNGEELWQLAHYKPGGSAGIWNLDYADTGGNFRTLPGGVSLVSNYRPMVVGGRYKMKIVRLLLGNKIQVYQDGVQVLEAIGIQDSLKVYPCILVYNTIVRIHSLKFDSEGFFDVDIRVGGIIPMTAIPANQEPRSQFLPQDVAWRGTPPMYAGPVNLQQQTQYPLCKGRDYYWIRDGVRNVEQGYIESTVTISGVGVRRRVLCFTQDGELVGETYSRASDGVYRFDLLWLNKRYMLVAQDDPAFGPADYNAVAADYQAPKPYPPGGGVAPAPFPMLAPLKRK